MEPYETFEHEGMTIELPHYDTDMESPFSAYDQAASLYWNGSTQDAKHYGAEPIDLDRFTSTAHAARYLTLMERCLVAIPFRIDEYGANGSRAYLTDTDDERAHGFVVVTPEGMETTGAPDALEAAKQDFATFAHWVAGEVSGFVVKDAAGNVLDSCWGFIGDPDEDDGVKDAAKSEAAFWAEQYREARAHPWLPTFGNPIQPAGAR